MSLQMRLRRNKRRQMLKRRRRFFGGVIGVILVVCTMMAIIGIPSTLASDGEYVAYTVSAGDTLWSIVGDVCNGDINMRKVIDEVKEVNNLKSSCITVGDTLLIPICN